MLDYHVHTSRCGHATGSMGKYVESGIKAGLVEMGFADHLPLYFLPEGKRDPYLAMGASELPGYVEEVYALQRLYPSFPIRLGIEADYIPGKEGELAAYLDRYEFDYVIGSVHMVGDWDVSSSRQSSRYSDEDIDDLYRRYFSLVQRAALSGLFDVIGHADVVKKFGHRPEGSLDAVYERTVHFLGAAGVCLEVNTAGLRAPAGELYPSLELIRACYEAGVPVTLGSDAHSPEEVGRDLHLAIELLKKAGYRKLTAFAGRKKRYVPI